MFVVLVPAAAVDLAVVVVMSASAGAGFPDDRLLVDGSAPILFPASPSALLWIFARYSLAACPVWGLPPRGVRDGECAGLILVVKVACPLPTGAPSSLALCPALPSWVTSGRPVPGSGVEARWSAERAKVLSARERLVDSAPAAPGLDAQGFRLWEGGRVCAAGERRSGKSGWAY